MATGSAISKFSHLFGRRSAVVIGMIHVDALPGIKIRYTLYKKMIFYCKNIKIWENTYAFNKIKCMFSGYVRLTAIMYCMIYEVISA